MARTIVSHGLDIAAALRDILRDNLAAQVAAMNLGAEAPGLPGEEGYVLGDLLLHAFRTVPVVCVSLDSPNGVDLQPHAIGHDATTGSPYYMAEVNITIAYAIEWTGKEIQIRRAWRAAEAIANVLAMQALSSSDPLWKNGLVRRLTAGQAAVERGARGQVNIYTVSAVSWRCLTWSENVA